MSEDSVTTAAQATRAVRKALEEAGIGTGDYELKSHKTDSGAESVVAVSAWSPPQVPGLVEEALKAVEGAKSTKRSGRSFSLTF